MRFAVVDDDNAALELIEKSIRYIGHECHTFPKGELLLKALRRESFDFLILDWELPDITGVEIIKRLRVDHKDLIPILLLTNRRDERDLIHGLSVGADDFMSKPVRVGEFLARVKALIRRTWENRIPQNYQWGDYTFHPESNSAEYKGETIRLKNKKFELALFLFQNQGRLLSRQHLLEQIWGIQSPAVNSRTLDTHISTLRKKLYLQPENGYYLTSVYGIGYRLVAVDANE
jgi:DNA-binding response OmpR family regulator